ncbi:MAG TPA: ATP-binding protein [Actinomycetales bacterium]|nr:ATP-binding protein [Actinomycetales bacterium]
MLLRGRLLLPPEPISVRHARRHVGEVLRQSGREQWADDAMLAVSELVSNVVLHAHTDCEVSVELDHDEDVRVSVRDLDTNLPTQQHFSAYATTGHGLSLVGQLSAECGIDSLGPDGKVVWFVLRGAPDTADIAMIDQEWDLTGLLPPDPPTPVGPVAVLPAVPMPLWLAGLEHHAAVLRELYLVQSGPHPTPKSTVGAQAGVDVSAADAALRALSDGTNRALAGAPAEEPDAPDPLPLPAPPPGTDAAPWVPPTLDVEVSLGDLDAAALVALQQALDLGQRLAMQGTLLVRPALDELVTLRDWACEQVVTQLSGGSPTPWDRELLAGPASFEWEPPEWDDTEVRMSARALVAGDDSNRLIAVSRAAAELLGGFPEDLVGQRITTIIPHRLRELHVAGFIRHLATGESRVLGVRVNLPVLRLDGREMLCCLQIEQLTAPPGRQVYVARMEPLPAQEEPGTDR